MDRNILTIGEQFDAADFDQTNKNAYVAIAKLAYAILGTDTLLNGFTCTQNSIPDLNVLIGPGEIYQMAAIDTTPYGDLPVDSHIILKQGVNLDALPDGTLTFTAPTTPGDSVNYLIEFALQEDDINDENREFYNAAPQVVPTIRQDSVFIKALAGTPAPTGTQTTPAPEVGFIGGFVVTIAYGQTTILNGDISVYDDANFITEKLKDKISQAFADARYGQITTIQSGGYLYAAAAGTANTYTASLSPIITTYTTGMMIRILINIANTGASTINLNSLGVKDIKLFGGVDLLPGELPADYLAELYYNGTEFILLNPPKIAFVASVTMAASQSIANTNTDILVNFDTVEYDSFSIWNNTTKVFTPGRLGFYRLSANLSGDSVPAGTLFMAIDKNGSGGQRLNEMFAGGGDITLSGSAIFQTTVLTDYFRLTVNNDTAGAFNVGLGLSDFQIEFIGT